MAVLSDRQLLSWFGPPPAWLNSGISTIPSDVPAELHSDWKLLKKHGYTDAEARVAIQPSIDRAARAGAVP